MGNGVMQTGVSPMFVMLFKLFPVIRCNDYQSLLEDTLIFQRSDNLSYRVIHIEDLAVI